MSDVVDAVGPTELAEEGKAIGEGELKAGSRAGEYRIVRLLGRGGMGEVYEGVQEAIGKRVAVKVIGGGLAGTEESCERFLREARAANRVAHRAVLDVFSAGRLEDGRMFLVMDLLQGRSLRQVISEGPLSVDEVGDLMREVCDAVGAAHAAGIVHRDLKPDNIFLAKVGGARQVFVLDFGIAKLLEDAARGQGLKTLTAKGAWIGTPAYMAPEQWTSDGASPRSDVYALGAVAHEALSGEPPYQADSVPALMEKHFHAPPPTLGGKAPAALDHVLARAMAKEPEDRYENAAELGRAIEGAIGGAVVAATVRGAGSSRARSLRPALYAALAVGVAAAALIGYRALAGGDSPSIEPAAGETPPTPAAVSIASTPSGARVWIDGAEIGKTPLRHEVAEPGVMDIRLAKPGYLPVSETASPEPGGELRFELPAPDSFEGIWKIDNGELRSFKRDGDRVACYRLTVVDGQPEHLRFFEFTPSEDATIHFTASAEAVDPRAPNEPSCRRDLAAEYRYDPATDELELRRQGDRVDFVDGKCVRLTVQWGEYKSATRIAARSASMSDMTYSGAGAGPTAAVDAVSSGDVDPSAVRVPQQKKKSRADAKKRAAKSAPNNLNPFGKDEALAREKGATAGAMKNPAPQSIEPSREEQNRAPQKKQPPAQQGTLD